VQVPIGLEEHHAGVVDLVRMEAVTFHGPNGTAATLLHFSSHPQPCSSLMSNGNTQRVPQTALTASWKVEECFAPAGRRRHQAGAHPGRPGRAVQGEAPRAGGSARQTLLATS
jgi:hypothetical protein